MAGAGIRKLEETEENQCRSPQRRLDPGRLRSASHLIPKDCRLRHAPGRPWRSIRGRNYRTGPPGRGVHLRFALFRRVIPRADAALGLGGPVQRAVAAGAGRRVGKAAVPIRRCAMCAEPALQDLEHCTSPNQDGPAWKLGGGCACSALGQVRSTAMLSISRVLPIRAATNRRLSCANASLTGSSEAASRSSA